MLQIPLLKVEDDGEEVKAHIQVQEEEVLKEEDPQRFDHFVRKMDTLLTHAIKSMVICHISSKAMVMSIMWLLMMNFMRLATWCLTKRKGISTQI